MEPNGRGEAHRAHALSVRNRIVLCAVSTVFVARCHQVEKKGCWGVVLGRSETECGNEWRFTRRWYPGRVGAGSWEKYIPMTKPWTEVLPCHTGRCCGHLSLTERSSWWLYNLRVAVMHPLMYLQLHSSDFKSLRVIRWLQHWPLILSAIQSASPSDPPRSRRKGVIKLEQVAS